MAVAMEAAMADYHRIIRHSTTAWFWHCIQIE